MNKRILLISGILLTTIFGGLGLYNVIDNKSRLVITNEKIEQVMKTNALTMMYETEAGSGEYRVSNDTSWPQEGYVFNEKLSDCENGGTLSWNDETKRVVLTTSTFDKCYVYFDKYLPTIINSVSASDISNNSITLTVNATVGENPIQVYYYSNNGGSSYVESNSNTYTFNGLETGTEYEFRVYVIDSNGVSSEVYSLQATTESAVYLANYIKSLYTSDGANGIYLHDGQGTYGSLEAGDNSYRYSGANPNNYVCFGSITSSCPNDNLYRIIGVFGDQVKLIKHDYATSTLLGTNGDYYGQYTLGEYYYKGSNYSNIAGYLWNYGINTWSESQLNTVNLNENYLANIGSEWSGKIAEHIWQVGGNTYQNIYNVVIKQAYTNEIINSATNATYNAKIGLMYVSDYGYAASPNNWNTILYNYDNDTNRNINWIYMGLYDWTITRYSINEGNVFVINTNGSVIYASPIDNVLAVRPTFYLNSDVAYISGTGTSSNPYIID